MYQHWSSKMSTFLLLDRIGLSSYPHFCLLMTKLLHHANKLYHSVLLIDRLMAVPNTVVYYTGYDQLKLLFGYKEGPGQHNSFLIPLTCGATARGRWQVPYYKYGDIIQVAVLSGDNYCFLFVVKQMVIGCTPQCCPLSSYWILVTRSKVQNHRSCLLCVTWELYNIMELSARYIWPPITCTQLKNK